VILWFLQIGFVLHTNSSLVARNSRLVDAVSDQKEGGKAWLVDGILARWASCLVMGRLPILMGSAFGIWCLVFSRQYLVFSIKL
jgi:hypothetical protein